MANTVDDSRDQLNKLKENFEDFLNVTDEARRAAETRRDYRDLKQWTDTEAAKLEERDQAPIVFDQFGKKVDAICGMEVQRRSDPKAYPVTPNNEKAAEAITDALRYVERKTKFDAIGSEVFEDKIVEGYGGAITEWNPAKKTIEIHQIPWDRTYYDPHSRNKDFSDSKVFGITLWMGKEDAKEINPKKAQDIDEMMSNQVGIDGTTFDDRPRWIDTKRKRVRVNQEYFVKDGVWHEAFYTGETFLKGPKPSPYKDCDGNPSCPIELQSDFVDRDNARYGYTERLKDPQDEINHRRSKALHLLSSKSVVADHGAFGQVSREEILEELRKGMTFLEPIRGSRVEIDNQQDLGRSQLEFYQDAKNSMDSVGINPELQGTTDSAISGRAFLARQQGGMIELIRIFARHSEWKERVYNQMWARMKQFWPEEKWVRVTDNEDATKFIGLNVPITRLDKMLEEQSGKDIAQIQMEAGDELEAMRQQVQAQNPELMEQVETRNAVPELDMDIVIEEAPDTINLQQEQFDTLAQLAGTRGDPQMFEALLRLSSLSKKDEVLEMLKPDDQAAQQQAQQQAELQSQMVQLEMADKAADLEVKKSEVANTNADTSLKQAQAKDEIASAMERISKASVVPFSN